MVGVGALGLSTSTDTAHMFPCAVLLAAFSQIIEAADFGFLHVSPAFVSRMENAIGVFVKTTTTADCIIRCFRSAAWGFVVAHITIGDSSRGRCTCGSRSVLNDIRGLNGHNHISITIAHSETLDIRMFFVLFRSDKIPQCAVDL